LQPSLSVYYRRDNLLPFNYWKNHAGRLEPQLIGNCDLVVCNSPQLNEFAQKFNANSFFIGQGVDLSSYQPDAAYELPERLNAIQGPKVGYIGDITSVRLNADLIYEMAVLRPEYSFIMIGPEDEYFSKHKLHELSNVYFFGRIPKSAVSSYIAGMDVCINPQLLNEVTMGNYPRKVDEYLAMGKPVVATKTGTMSLFKDHVFCCTDVKEFVLALDKAVQDKNVHEAKRRIEFAQSHSWKNNVNNLLELIYIHLKPNKMYYRSINDLNNIILQRLHILPKDFDLIVGVPRSGMLPANLLALYLNKPYTDLHSFICSRYC